MGSLHAQVHRERDPIADHHRAIVARPDANILPPEPRRVRKEPADQVELRAGGEFEVGAGGKHRRKKLEVRI
jgi:hypothetical protein